jgi:hypothetical protein
LPYRKYVRFSFRTDSAHQLLALFLSGRSPKTLAAYRCDLKHFCAFIGAADSTAAARQLLDRSQGEVHARLLRYRAHLLDSGLRSCLKTSRVQAVQLSAAVLLTVHDTDDCYTGPLLKARISTSIPLGCTLQRTTRTSMFTASFCHSRSVVSTGSTNLNPSARQARSPRERPVA